MFSCVTLSDPILVFGLGFDSICFGSCFVSMFVFWGVMLVLASGSLVLTFDLGGVVSFRSFDRELFCCR